MKTLRWLPLVLALVPGVAAAHPPDAACPGNCPCAHMGQMMGPGQMAPGQMRSDQMRPGPMMGPGADTRLYDPATVQTFDGQVIAVTRVPMMRGTSEGLHATVRTAGGDLEVRLGPAWYLDHQNTQLQVGDRVQVRGSQITLMGKPIVIANEVRRGDQRLFLRDLNGVPAWRAWRSQ